MKKLLEVCVDSLASARAAQAGGADRLEFCSALAVGGLSPYPELLRQIKAECSLPVRCLMRPRAGDFLYTKDEIDLLCAQIHTLRDTGADGFVIGALTPDGALDKPAMAQLLDACGDKPVTLHRCIDVSCDLAGTYRDAATLGIDTVLTSGGARQLPGRGQPPWPRCLPCGTERKAGRCSSAQASAPPSSLSCALPCPGRGLSI